MCACKHICARPAKRKLLIVECEQHAARRAVRGNGGQILFMDIGFVAGGANDLEDFAASAIGGGGDIGDRRQPPDHPFRAGQHGHQQDRANEAHGKFGK